MRENEDFTSVFQRPGFLFRRCHQLSASVFEDEVGEYSITQSQYGVLLVLHSKPDIDQITLAGLIGRDRSTTALVINILRKKGLLVRYGSPSDKRKKILRLTDTGEELLEQIEPAFQRVQQRVLSSLDESETELLLALLGKVLRASTSEIRVPLDIESARALPGKDLN